MKPNEKRPEASRAPEDKDTNDIDSHALESVQIWATDTDIDISIEEIKNAIAALKNNKAPDIDSITGEIHDYTNITQVNYYY